MSSSVLALVFLFTTPVFALVVAVVLCACADGPGSHTVPGLPVQLRATGTMTLDLVRCTH